MTVMNKEELAKLNQVYKGSLLTGDDRLQNRQPTNRRKNRRNRTSSQNSEEKPNWVTNVASEFRVSVHDDVNKLKIEPPIPEENPEEVEIIKRTNTKGTHVF